MKNRVVEYIKMDILCVLKTMSFNEKLTHKQESHHHNDNRMTQVGHQLYSIFLFWYIVGKSGQFIDEQVYICELSRI